MDHAVRRAGPRPRDRRAGRSRLEEPPRSRDCRRSAPGPRRRTGPVPRAGPQGDRLMILELAVCAAVLVAAYIYIFHLPGKLYLGPEKTRASYLRERKDAVYENLRDLNFEYTAGKVPDDDYHSLKSSLQDEAATLLAEIARLEAKAASEPGKARS